MDQSPRCDLASVFWTGVSLSFSCLRVPHRPDNRLAPLPALRYFVTLSGNEGTVLRGQLSPESQYADYLSDIDVLLPDTITPPSQGSWMLLITEPRAVTRQLQITPLYIMQRMYHLGHPTRLPAGHQLAEQGIRNPITILMVGLVRDSCTCSDRTKEPRWRYSPFYRIDQAVSNVQECPGM